MLVRHQFGSEIDWYLRLFDDKESTVSLNRQRSIGNLAAAYVKTGDENYARHAARLLWSFYRQCPIPNYQQSRPLAHAGSGRPAVARLDGYDRLPGPDRRRSIRRMHSMLARSRFEHMRYLMAFCGGPNNWYQVEASGMAVAALYSPELKDAMSTCAWRCAGSSGSTASPITTMASSSS